MKKHHQTGFPFSLRSSTSKQQRELADRAYLDECLRKELSPKWKHEERLAQMRKPASRRDDGSDSFYTSSLNAENRLRSNLGNGCNWIRPKSSNYNG